MFIIWLLVIKMIFYFIFIFPVVFLLILFLRKVIYTSTTNFNDSWADRHWVMPHDEGRHLVAGS